MSNRDIGFIEPGQAAEIKVGTFNFTRYGLLHSQVLAGGLPVASFHDLVGAGEQRLRQGKAKRRCGLKIDHQLDFC